MKREARHLLDKAEKSLILAIELFNRPHEGGRVDGVLILLDHAFEMFLKAAILHRGGQIREVGQRQTIGFDHCVRKAVSDGNLKFLAPEQALTLQTLNGYRDAAQHHLVELSEQLFYTYVRAGVTLFGDLIDRVFDRRLREFLPARILPISSEPPKDLPIMLADEVEVIRTLVASGKRQRIDAKARLRALVIAESAAAGEYSQPSEQELDGVVNRIKKGETWEQVFPGLSQLVTTVEGDGIPFSIRITKKEGTPVTLVPEGTPGARVVAVRRVNELDFYNLSHGDLAAKTALTPPKLTAVLRALNVESQEPFCKEFKLGGITARRFSQEALKHIKEELPKLDMTQVWKDYRPKRKVRD